MGWAYTLWILIFAGGFSAGVSGSLLILFRYLQRALAWGNRLLSRRRNAWEVRWERFLGEGWRRRVWIELHVWGRAPAYLVADCRLGAWWEWPGCLVSGTRESLYYLTVTRPRFVW